MIGRLVEFIASQVADKALDRMIKHFDMEYDLLSGKLGVLEEKADAQLLRPLRAGLTFLRLGYLEKALEEFVRAEALDPFAAASKFYLGLTLLRSGRHVDAAPFIRGAIYLNPYIAEGFFDPSALLHRSPEATPIPGRRWERSLLDGSTISSLPKKKLQFFPDMFAQRRSAAIRFVTTIAPHPIVAWLLGGDLLDSPEGFVSAFDVLDGRCLWSESLLNSTLHLVAPGCVVLKSHDDPPLFKLLSISDGCIVRTMSDEYFRLAFWGGRNASAHGVSFASLSCELMPLKMAYGKTRTEIAGRGPRRLVNIVRAFPFDHNDVPLLETVSLPILDSRNFLFVRNKWSHAHVSYGEGGAACGLWSSATLGAQ